MTEEVRPTTRPQRLRKRMEKDADRQAVRREAMRQQGSPDTHAVDRAIAEAVAYLAVQNHRDGEKKGNAMLMFRDIAKVASRILSHESRFDLLASMSAVAHRLGNRKSHRWSLPAPKREANLPPKT